MATPNMATITASLERSLQKCSLNHLRSSSSSSSIPTGADDDGAAHCSDLRPRLSATPALELNSEASLPFHWEQCLDLKTGEIYYINWRTGMKAKESPRTMAEYCGNYYSDYDSTSFDSEGSCSESSPSPSREQRSGNNNNNQENCYFQGKNEIDENNDIDNNSNNNNNVLVVAGCKSCLMYYMVPKQLDICPKCCGQLLHF